MTVLGAMANKLGDLAIVGRRRSLVPRGGLDFASNDYLGLAGSLRLREAAVDAITRGVAVGSGGSRLLRGNCDEHERLEAEAASFFGSETALFASGGYGPIRFCSRRYRSAATLSSTTH
jgi:8-amino-7-oxononanoate synthase